MTKILIGASASGSKVNLDLDILLRTRLLIQANSGGGKSWLIRLLCERAFGKVQIVIIDPEGEFATLREKFDYVLVGQGGETPADVRSAGLVAHKLLELHASAVCDLYEMKASQRHEWVKAFLDALLDAPKNLWHPVLVIVDEAHQYAPEKGAGESVASDAMIGLATRGRKRGFCAVFATQRLGKLRKDAAAELTNVLIGQTFIDIDRKRAAEALGIPRSDERAFNDEMKVIEPGHFWGLGRALCLERTLLKIGGITTTHPEPGSAKYSSAPPPAPEKIKSLLPKLSDLPQEAERKAKTESELRSELAALRRQLSARPTVSVPQVETKTVEVPVFRDGELERLESTARSLSDLSAQLNTGVRDIFTSIKSAAAIRKPLPTMPVKQIQRNAPTARKIVTGGEAYNLPVGEKKILTACAQYQDGLERDKLTTLTGYKRSTRDAYIKRLTERGFVEVNGKVSITDDGLAALGDYEELPFGAALYDYWMNRLPLGEKALLEVLCESGAPTQIHRDVLTERTGYKRSTRDAYLKRMFAKRIITLDGPGFISASVELFD